MPLLSKNVISACLGLLLFPINVNAEETTRKMALATELTELMHVRQIGDALQAQCGKQEGSQLDPRKLFAADPGFFGGITPASAYWPEILDSYGRYQKKACDAVSSDKFIRFFTEGYASKLSENDLEITVKFFSSASGQRYNAASAEINLEFQAYEIKEIAKVAIEAYREAQLDLLVIMRKYKNKPQ